MGFPSLLFGAIIAAIIIFLGIVVLTGNFQSGPIEYVEEPALRTNVRGYVHEFLDQF